MCTAAQHAGICACRYWAIALDSIMAGSSTVPGLEAQGVLLDSGTSLILASESDAAAINQVKLHLLRFCLAGNTISCPGQACKAGTPNSALLHAGCAGPELLGGC